MAAEMAVESTAQETDLTEDSQQRAGHSEETAQEDHLVKAQKEEASAEIVQEDLLERILSAQEEHSERIQKEGALVETVQEDHSERTLSVQEDHLVKAQKEEVSAEIVQEEHSERTLSVQEEHSERVLKEEDSAEENQPEEVSTQQRKASTRATSTISVMRRKAESTK